MRIMMKPTCVSASIACGLLLSIPALGIELGEPAGAVSLLTLDGHRLVMNNYRERKGTAIVFLSGRCDATQRAIESIIQGSAGTIHVTYTFRRYAIKHVEMNEDWLVRLERPN